MSLLAASRGEWNDFHDPTVLDAPRDEQRCTVRLSRCGWEHVRADHIVANAEPWGDWLSAASLGVLRQPLPVSGPIPADVDAAAERIRQEMCHSLGRPLVILYEGVVRRGPSRPTWVLVLPSGSRLVVHQRPRSGNEVITCFFPRAACAEVNPARRWRANARKLLFRFVVKDTTINAFVPPPAGELFPGGSATELARARVRFVNLPSWGFREDAPCTWGERFPDWPDAAPPAQPPRLHRLKKRRWPEQT